MDFTKAAILIAAVFGVTEWIKANVSYPKKYNGLVALAAAIAVVFLVGATVWANTQVIGEVTLDKLGVWDKLFAGILIGAGASTLHATFDSIRNVGQNQ